MCVPKNSKNEALHACTCMCIFEGLKATPFKYAHVPLHIGHTITKYVVKEAGGVKSMGDHELEEKLQAM